MIRTRLSTAASFALLGLAVSVSRASADDAAWLARQVPPAWEGGTPFTIKKVDVSRNHVDQEVVRVEFERTKAVVRTLAREAKVIILPVNGGRHEVWMDPGIGVSPRQSGTISGIADGLLDYRGRIPGGARAYVELTFANVAKKQDPVRVSEVFWIGASDELKAARQGEPADPGDGSRQSVPLVDPPDDMTLPAGMPVRLAGGPRWYNSTLRESAAAGQPLKLIAYLARPGGLYLPWEVTADRKDVKVEGAAVDAARSDVRAFSDRLRDVEGRLAAGSAPLPLVPVNGKVAAGDRVVWFGLHGLMGGDALEDAKGGRVRVRDSRFKQESVLELRRLFVDPEPPK